MQKLFENWRGYTDEPEAEALNEGPFDFLDPYTKPYKRIYKKSKKNTKGGMPLRGKQRGKPGARKRG